MENRQTNFFNRIKLLVLLIFSLSIIFSQISEGYTLYTPTEGLIFNDTSPTTYLRDSDWEIFNTWEHDCGPASMPYLFLNENSEQNIDNSLLYYPCRSNLITMDTGGVGGQVKIYDWDGQLIWQYELANEFYQHHHDIAVMENGNFLVIAWERLYSNEWQQLGRETVDNNLSQMWMSAIFEISPDLTTSHQYELVWEWHIKDHLIQDRDEEYISTFGIISEHPELMDINKGCAGCTPGPDGLSDNADWMHINSIDYNRELDQIVISSRFQNEIYIIDHSTTTEQASSHIGGNSGKGGDFLYRWGNPENYNQGDITDRVIYAQHGINWIPSWYPIEAGPGNLILFNNGLVNQNVPDYESDIIEITPPLNEDGIYNLDEDGTYGPDTFTWIYTGPFFTLFQGGAFRMPNGNTIITDADDRTIIEVTYDGIETFSYSYEDATSLIARAEKYPIELFNETIIGDLNNDSLVNVIDVVLLVSIIFNLENSIDEADINGDGIINILDVVSLVNIILF